jgi:hypothetical protein
MRLRSLALPFVLALAACGPSDEEARLDRTYRFTVHALRDVGRNPVAAAAYQSALEGGGTPVSYLVAGAPAQADFSDLVYDGPATPWTVVISDGDGETELVVEAYGATTDAPLQSETVDLAGGR